MCGDNGAGADLDGDMTQCSVAMTAEGVLVATGRGHGDHAGAEAEGGGAGHDGAGLVGAALTLLMVDADHHGVDAAGIARGAVEGPWPRLAERPRVWTTRDGEDRARRQVPPHRQEG